LFDFLRENLALAPIYSTEQYKSDLAAADRNATTPSNAHAISISAASTLLVVAMAAFVALEVVTNGSSN
jgi:hypothetical protein